MSCTSRSVRSARSVMSSRLPIGVATTKREPGMEECGNYNCWQFTSAMPLYEYQCQACGSTFELIRKFSDPPVETCTACGSGPVKKLVSSPAFQFKGSGWYVTDYARKGAGGSSGDE